MPIDPLHTNLKQDTSTVLGAAQTREMGIAHSYLSSRMREIVEAWYDCVWKEILLASTRYAIQTKIENARVLS